MHSSSAIVRAAERTAHRSQTRRRRLHPQAPAAPDDAGSALLLFPAGLLIVLILAALAFDLSLAFQRKRALLEMAEAAANDAVTFGLDERRLRVDGSYCLDDTRVARSVAASIAASGSSARVERIQVVGGVAAGCSTGVVVTLSADVDQPFSGAVPGLATHTSIEATGRATAVVR